MLIDSLFVDLDRRSYEILIGAGLLDHVGARLKPLLPGRQVAIVSNTAVAPLYMARVEAALRQQGLDTLPIVLPDGESYKGMSHLQRIFDALIEHRYERSCTLVALGGGVVGDMTGFAAATFLRGVTFVQIPTTLLSQVDASVGGKTGINHPLGKNLIGAFHQPRMVAIDVDTLDTLPERERLAGLAEVIKYGIIRDAEFFQQLEQVLPDILTLDRGVLMHVIRTCCAIKARVVAADEREAVAGSRALLNYGHTFAHAIEALTGFGTILHGEAVAIGMIMAADFSHRMGLCREEDVARIRALIQRAALPSVAPRFPAEQYLEAMTRDKKVMDGVLRFVLIDAIGHAAVHHGVPVALLKETLAACGG